MKRNLAALSAWIVVLMVFCTPAAGEVVEAKGDPPVLCVYNWSEYIDIDETLPEDLPIEERSPSLRAFMEQNHCRIEYHEFEEMGDLDLKVLNLPGFIDVVVISVEDVISYAQAGRLAPLSEKEVPNKANIAPKYARMLKGMACDGFCAPYLLGTTGLIYRKDLVGKKVTSWKDYYEPPSSMRGRMAALNCGYSMIYSSLLYNGHSLNSLDDVLIKEAARNIIALKQGGYLNRFTSDIEEIQQALLSGEIAMIPLYSGDALAAVEMDPEGRIEYVIPEEGAEMFMDNFAVLKDSTKKELAYRFVDFMLKPEVHSANAVYLGYICPNAPAKKIIEEEDPEFLMNPAVYPPEKLLDKLEIGKVRHDDINRLWLRITKE